MQTRMMAWPALFFSINSLINQHSLRTKDGGQSPWSGVLCVYIIICHNAHAHYVYLYQYGCSCTDCSPYAQVHGYYSAVSTGVIPLISTFIESTSLRAYTREQGPRSPGSSSNSSFTSCYEYPPLVRHSCLSSDSSRSPLPLDVFFCIILVQGLQRKMQHISNPSLALSFFHSRSSLSICTSSCPLMRPLSLSIWKKFH